MAIMRVKIYVTNSLKQGLIIFSYKGPNSKYFRLCGHEQSLCFGEGCGVQSGSHPSCSGLFLVLCSGLMGCVWGTMYVAGDLNQGSHSHTQCKYLNSCILSLASRFYSFTFPPTFGEGVLFYCLSLLRYYDLQYC